MYIAQFQSLDCNAIPPNTGAAGVPLSQEVMRPTKRMENLEHLVKLGSVLEHIRVQEKRMQKHTLIVSMSLCWMVLMMQ